MAETVTGRAHPALPSAARRVFPRVFPCILLAAVLVLCLVPDDSRAVAPGTAEFIFFDVGQGDASLIRTESGCVLIDTGTNLSEDTLAASLEWLGVRRIDCLILTHAHEDHIGGADRILRDFDVRAVIARDTGETDAATRRLWDAVRASGAEQVTPAGITTYTVGGLCLDVAVPFAEPQSAGNDNSLIVRVRFGETTFLYMGDAEAATEQVLLARLADGDFLDCDGLKLGHRFLLRFRVPARRVAALRRGFRRGRKQLRSSARAGACRPGSAGLHLPADGRERHRRAGLGRQNAARRTVTCTEPSRSCHFPHMISASFVSCSALNVKKNKTKL